MAAGALARRYALLHELRGCDAVCVCVCWGNDGMEQKPVLSKDGVAVHMRVARCARFAPLSQTKIRVFHNHPINQMMGTDG